MVSMLLAMVLTSLGIHQRRPATSPSSLRSVKVALSFRTCAVASWVVVIQTSPTRGNRVATTGPDTRKLAIALGGSRKKASLVKSRRGVMGSPVWLVASDADGARRGRRKGTERAR